MKQRKHANLIKAWADGASIQINTSHGWQDIEDPQWSSNSEYRVAPTNERYLRLFATESGEIDFIVRKSPDVAPIPCKFDSWLSDWVVVCYDSKTRLYSSIDKHETPSDSSPEFGHPFRKRI